MTSLRGTIVKFGAFAAVMALLTVFLFFIFSQYRTGSTNGYSAVFGDVSRLKTGQTVRVAGIRVGTVQGVSLRPDKKVLVKFDADRSVVLTGGTRAVVRYLNLTGDRYLELVDGPGSTTVLPAGSQIPVDRTAPALDLDLLLGGLRPVISGLNPKDVNALSASLIQIFQGEGGTLDSLLSKTSSFSNTLADNDQTVQQLIDHLNTVVGTLSKDGDKFSGALDRLQRLISGFSQDRDTIGTAIDSLDQGTASIASLLTNARPPLAGTVDQLSRLAPLLDDNKGQFDVALQKLPNNYRKLVRLGSYGSWLPYYLCELSLRVSDLQYHTVVVPIFRQEAGRCAEPSEQELRAAQGGAR
jgi:phospholipid/cholesterol/gamma-HCH transport system substrate-binding protein